MKKIVLLNSQIQQVVELHDKGISWVKIEKETGIARRIAKRAYDEWIVKQSQRQLEDARKDVVAQEYRIHLDLLSQMANLLIDSLTIPHPLTDLRRGDEVMRQFLSNDIYQDLPLFRLRIGNEQREKRVIRMNGLLFKSLCDHTERKAPWQVLKLWKETRDSCVKDIGEIKEEIHTVFTNILKQKPKLKEQLDKFYMKSSVIENVEKGILINIWLNSILGVKSEVVAMKSAGLLNEGIGWVVFHKNASEGTNVTFDRESPDDNERLAMEVSDVSKWTITNILKSKSDLIQIISGEVTRMQESVIQLEAVLNPLVLRPIILNTQCDICPI
jgi:hypothetical protein